MTYEFKESDAFDFARKMGLPVKPKGSELKFIDVCPYCNGGARRDKDTFSIDLKSGQFKCLRSSCSVQGNMITLSRDFDFDLGLVSEYQVPKKQYKKLSTPKVPIQSKNAAIQYLEKRGISERIARQYEITVQKDNETILVFPFYDENKKLQFVKYRKTDFDKAKDKNKEWCEANCKPILFGMKQCNDKFDCLIITEGQIDSLTLAECGIENAVSVPTGKNGFTWVPYCWDFVMKFEEIIVFGDMEQKGMTLLDDLKKRFQKKIRAVRKEDYKGCKDANELFTKYGKQSVIHAVTQAELMPVNRVIQLADVEKVDIYKLPKLKTGVAELDQILCGGLFFGQVDIIAGKRGDGKSTFASQILVNAIEQGYKSFVYSGELPNYLFKAWIDFQIAGKNHITENTNVDGTVSRFITNQNTSLINNWYRDQLYLYDTRIIETEEQEDIIKTIRNTILQYGVKVILIDNLMTAIDLDQENAEKYDKQSNFVKKLAHIALKYDVLILLVAHRRKNKFSEDANDEISGSGDITNLAGVVVSYDRDKELLETQRKLVLSKSRLIGRLKLDGFVLDYDERSKRIYGAKDDFNKQYSWDQSDGFIDIDMEIPFD